MTTTTDITIEELFTSRCVMVDMHMVLDDAGNLVSTSTNAAHYESWQCPMPSAGMPPMYGEISEGLIASYGTLDTTTLDTTLI
jgi:hypothetical protein